MLRGLSPLLGVIDPHPFSVILTYDLNVVAFQVDEEFKGSGVREINVTHLRYHHSSITKYTNCTLISKFFIILFEILLSGIRSISTRNITNVSKSIKFENAWIYFSRLFIEREVLSQTYRSHLTSLLEKVK